MTLNRMTLYLDQDSYFDMCIFSGSSLALRARRDLSFFVSKAGEKSELGIMVGVLCYKGFSIFRTDFKGNKNVI